MGVYVKKVTATQVKLANGEVANVALFAYKCSWNNPDGIHSKSGAAACDRAAENGKRSQWIVYGYRNGDKIEINRKAQKATRSIGSFVEEFPFTEECEVVLGRSKKIRFFR